MLLKDVVDLLLRALCHYPVLPPRDRPGPVPASRHAPPQNRRRRARTHGTDPGFGAAGLAAPEVADRAERVRIGAGSREL
jgi:hypothetical protein